MLVAALVAILGYRALSEMYLAEWCNISKGSVLDNLISFAWVAQLGVTLHSFGGQAHACGLAAGGIWGVEVVVPLKNHQLALGLGDVRGERLEDVAKGHLHLRFQLCSWSQT